MLHLFSVSSCLNDILKQVQDDERSTKMFDGLIWSSFLYCLELTFRLGCPKNKSFFIKWF